jgi:hypothetical protein
VRRIIKHLVDSQSDFAMVHRSTAAVHHGMRSLTLMYRNLF